MKLMLLMNGVILIASLVPFRSSLSEGKVPSDGLNIWLIWKRTPHRLTATRTAYFCLEADACQRKHKFDESTRWLDRGLRELPGNHTLSLVRASFLLLENKLEEARQALLGLREILANDKALLPVLLNNIAYADAVLGSPELLVEADLLSEQALQAAPSHVFCKGTRGFVHVLLDRFNEGVPLLKQAFRDHTEKCDKATIACCLGIAAQRQGNLAESRRCFALARKLDPRCLLLDRCPQD
jgi:tetratricopeptide (TPR) repeat protein